MGEVLYNKRPDLGDESTDYILDPEASSAWVEVDNISVYILRTDEGVVVDLYPNGYEMEDPLVGTWALFNEAQNRIDYYEREEDGS